MWRQDFSMQYLIPGSVDQWAIVLVCGRRREDLDLRAFAQGLVATGSKKGIRMQQPVYANVSAHLFS